MRPSKKQQEEARQVYSRPTIGVQVNFWSLSKPGPAAGDVLRAEWAGGMARMRLVRRYKHPAGNGWEVRIFDERRGRFSATPQYVSDASIAAARR